MSEALTNGQLLSRLHSLTREARERLENYVAVAGDGRSDEEAIDLGIAFGEKLDTLVSGELRATRCATSKLKELMLQEHHYG
jgi:hypothetical protein